MFYAHIILAKKGPLARVWLAAHWDKKITKAHVFETNIEKSVEGIMQPKVKLALRTSGHLLLGVVRIYSRKAKYLLADCNEAFVKIKMAFRPGMVDLPEGHREANINAITLPEVFHDFDTALPELNDIDIEAQFSINQSRADEITMREDYGSLSLSLHDDGFGDIGFEGDTPDLIRGALDSNINDHLFQDDAIGNVTETSESNVRLNEAGLSSCHLDGDEFPDEFDQPELFEGDLFGEPPIDSVIAKEKSIPNAIEAPDGEGVDHFNTGGHSPASSCHNSSFGNENDGACRETEVGEIENPTKTDKIQLDQSTLLQNEEESFALAPIDASAYKGITKTKRKRKLIVDEVKNISGEEMKAQLANTSDIVTTLDLAPPTKRLMFWKETGGVEKLFSLPSRSIPARALFVNYHRHLISHFTQLEDFSCLGPNDLLALDHIHVENESPAMILSKRGRKRKIDALPVAIQNINDIGDVTAASLAVPEVLRDQDGSIAQSCVYLNIGESTHDTVTAKDNAVFAANQSPQPMFSLNNTTTLDNLTSLTDIPFTSVNVNSIDNCDDFNTGDMTPAELPHGQFTPHHSANEAFEHIPHLPTEQISSILHEAENILPCSNFAQNSNINRSCEIATDWNDYDFPTSIGIQNTSDEQMENETNEQFEERVLNKRAAQLFFAVKTRMVKQDCLLLSELTVRNTRKQAAQVFYSLLVLKKFRALNIIQSAPYSDINISRGPLFENPKL